MLLSLCHAGNRQRAEHYATPMACPAQGGRLPRALYQDCGMGQEEVLVRVERKQYARLIFLSISVWAHGHLLID